MNRSHRASWYVAAGAIFRVWLPILLCLTLGGTLTAQNNPVGQIVGSIIDESGDNLPGATIYIKELQKGEISDAKGVFTFSNLPLGTYTLTIQYTGYETQNISVTVSGERKKVVVQLKPEDKAIQDVLVVGKSNARKLREQAMPVSVVSMHQLQGAAGDIESVLAKTTGIAIRASGGVGSASRISLRGLEGKRVGFFIDELPLTEQSDFIDLNDIPLDMIDRIEIYKGVVPAKFGGSSLGGAVNIVIREYPDKYLDLSYQHESFNVNKATAVFKRNAKESGIIFGIGGSYTYADNSYTMESPYVNGLKIKRTHDNFRKLMVGGSIKARKWWFDEIELEPVFVDTRKEIQGVAYDIRAARTVSQLYALGNTFKKKDFLLAGLDLDFTHGPAFTRYSLIDTAKTWYDWLGNPFPTVSPLGGEIGTHYASLSDSKKVGYVNKLNLEYLVTEQHTLTLNSFFSLAYGFPRNPIKEQSLGKKTEFDSKIMSWVVGLTYDFRTANDRFLNSFTVRGYWYNTRTAFQNIYTNTPAEQIRINKINGGCNDALRFRITRACMAKLSGGYDVRIPSESELLGDGYSITPSEQLQPERNANLNAGFLFDLTGLHPSNLQIELNGFYMYLQDMIRYSKGMLGAQYQNFGEMQTLGAEFEIKADIFSFLYGYGNVTFQDLRDVREHAEGSNLRNPTKGLRMPNIPYLMANAGLEFHKENPFGGQGQNVRLFADLAFTEEYFYDFELTVNAKRRIPRSLLLDIGLEYSFFNQRLFVSGKVNNLTNARVLSEFNYPLPGRSFGAKIRYIWK